MSKKDPKIVKGVTVEVKPTKELTKAIASEILYTDENECLEEIFEKGKEIGTTRNIRNDNKSGD